MAQKLRQHPVAQDEVRQREEEAFLRSPIPSPFCYLPNYTPSIIAILDACTTLLTNDQSHSTTRCLPSL